MSRKSPAHWSIAQIMEDRTDRSGGPNACWPWTRSTNRRKSGYGRFTKDGVDILAHQAAWEIANNQKLCAEDRILHDCDNPLRCNPKHLTRGTQAGNVADMNRKGRRAATHGAANPRAVLSEEQVRSIFLDRRPDVDLHRATGVPKATINHIRKRRFWQTVTADLPDVPRDDGRRKGWHIRRGAENAA